MIFKAGPRYTVEKWGLKETVLTYSANTDGSLSQLIVGEKHEIRFKKILKIRKYLIIFYWVSAITETLINLAIDASRSLRRVLIKL